MKKLLCLTVGAALVGCVNFSTNFFRTEQTATGAAYTAYQGYTNGVGNGTIVVTPGERDAIKAARIRFAAAVLTAEGWRQAYETNSAMQPQAQAALTALIDDSSNVVYLINLVKVNK